MGSPEWALRDMFDEKTVRGQNKDLIYPLVEEWTMQRDKMDIMDICQAEGAPVTAVFTIDELISHPHLRTRDYFTEIEHAELGRLEYMGAPFKLPDCPGGPPTPAPLLGEHNEIVFEEITR